MQLPMRRPLLVSLLATLTLAGCGGRSDRPAAAAMAFAEPRLAECALKSPYRQVGAGLDAPGRLEIEVTAGRAGGACGDNQAYRFGSGLHDITGPVANTGGMGWEAPTQVFSGLHQRQYARAYAIASPCNGQRVIFVSTDTGMIFGAVRQHVLQAIAADAELARHYRGDNVMLSATHTHQGPAGYSHYEAFNLFHFGFDELVLRTIGDGVVEAIRRAHANLEAHPETGSIRLAVGELLDTNINRSLPAFERNSEAERREFVNARGEPVDTDKRFVQLNLVRRDGTAVGVINWFGVHPTMLGTDLKLVSSDMKGYASLGFERIMRTDYVAAPGRDSFVAAFAQTDEGDSSPNLFIRERPFPDPTRGGGRDAYESVAISGTKQLAKSLELFGEGRPLSGPVDFRLFHVQMDAVTVTDAAVLSTLRHPPELDAPVKRTCVAALGPSFGAGAEDGPGPTVEGVSCASDPDLVSAAAADFMAASAGKIPPSLAATAVLCNVDRLPAVDLACHAEKPVLFVVGPPLSAEPNILPLQLFRLGNLAIVGVPWEVTTMSARRLRKTLLEVLAPVGVDTVIVSGLVNDYSHYLTTREEYASQQYEGASNIYGPWTLAAVQQETRKLALALRDGQPAPSGPAYVDATPRLVRAPYLPSDQSAGHAYGELLRDVPAQAAPGDTVRAEFQAGHPRNDLKLQSSYVYAERQRADGRWEIVASDRDPELWFVWKPQFPSPLPIDPALTGPSTAEAVWTIPRDAEPGLYRLRHEGATQEAAPGPLLPYSGVSGTFRVEGARAECP